MATASNAGPAMITEQDKDRSDLFTDTTVMIRSSLVNGHHLQGACVAIRTMSREERRRSVGIFGIVTRSGRHGIMTENKGAGVLEYAVTAYRDGMSAPGWGINL